MILFLLGIAAGLLLAHCIFAGWLPPSPRDWGWWWTRHYWHTYYDYTYRLHQWRVRHAHKTPRSL